MVAAKSFEMRLDCTGDLFRILDGQEMANNLRVVLRLPWKAERRIKLFRDFSVGHHLNNLRRPGEPKALGRLLRYFAVHKS